MFRLQALSNFHLYLSHLLTKFWWRSYYSHSLFTQQSAAAKGETGIFKQFPGKYQARNSACFSADFSGKLHVGCSSARKKDNKWPESGQVDFSINLEFGRSRLTRTASLKMFYQIQLNPWGFPFLSRKYTPWGYLGNGYKASARKDFYDQTDRHRQEIHSDALKTCSPLHLHLPIIWRTRPKYLYLLEDPQAWWTYSLARSNVLLSNVKARFEGQIGLNSVLGVQGHMRPWSMYFYAALSTTTWD